MDRHVTTGQIMSSSYTPDKIFDGIVNANNRWHSPASTVFPKILVVDAGKESYYINKFIIYQHPTSTSRYANNEPIGEMNRLIRCRYQL